MSAWRILVRRMYSIGGGPAKLAEIDDESLPLKSVRGGLLTAQELGLVDSDPPNKNTQGQRRWWLTGAGFDFAEGRAKIVRHSNHREYLHATWLKSLPRGGEIRL